MCLQPKTWNLIGKPRYRLLTLTQECSFQWKNSFFVIDQYWCKASFFRNWPAQITKIIKVVLAKWNGKLIAVSYLMKKLPHIVKAASEKWPNPRAKVNSTLEQFFQNDPCWEMNIMPNVNFALSSKNKDQLRDLINYLNQKKIAVTSKER